VPVALVMLCVSLSLSIDESASGDERSFFDLRAAGFVSSTAVGWMDAPFFCFHQECIPSRQHKKVSSTV